MGMAQWWVEWEMRILVLASLGAQYLLVLFAGVRKFHIPPWLRFSFRLAHIGSDALALFALATLFDRQKSGPRCSYAAGGRDLELLWAPILLMHLGGQVVITTYKIEDNEQWSSYILTYLSKVAVATYVFYKTWSSNDKKLFVGTVLLFALLIIRCFQKALALKSSSFNALRKTNSSEVNVVRGTNVGEEERLDRFVQETKDIMGSGEPLGRPVGSPPSLPYQLFLDFPCSYTDRLEMVKIFQSHDHESAYCAIEGALSAMTSFLYTKDDAGGHSLGTLFLALRKAPASFLFRVFTQLVPSATRMTVSLLVFQIHHKKTFDEKDIMFTFFLLQFSMLLDAVYMYVQSAFQNKFSGRVLQHSLIGLFAHNRRQSTLRRVAGWLRCKDELDGFWHLEPSDSCEEITELVRCHVKAGRTEYIRDPYSYRMFNDTRGEWTLGRNRLLQQLGWSTRRPFDESILLWHLATDLYIHQTSTSLDDNSSARRCKEMSNYMMHLLSNNPEMLMPGSRKRLLETACEELEVFLGGERIPRDERELTQSILGKCESASHSVQDTPSLIGGAWNLAQSLLCVDETRIWSLVQGVWLEMLCFSASRCRGYLHAETLGTGVEYLSYVWVLLAHTGMETFPEKLQRREGHSFDSGEHLDHGLPREGGDVVNPLAHTGMEMSPENIQRREEGHSFDNDESSDLGLARESGDVATPLASQSEITEDVVLEVSTL